VKVWDAETGHEIHTLNGHESHVLSVSFSPDGKRITSGSYDRTVKIWDVGNGSEVVTIEGHTDGVTSVAYSPNGMWIGSGSGDRTVRIWDIESGQEVMTFKGHESPVEDIVFSPDGQWIASAGADGTVKLWDVNRPPGTVTFVGKSQPSDWRPSAISLEGNRIADWNSTEANPGVTILDATSGREIVTLKGDADDCSLAFSSDGSSIASCGGVIQVWDTDSGEKKMTLPVPPDFHGDSCITFSPDAKQIASGGMDGKLRVWDLAKGEEIVSLTGHTDEITCLSFKSDGVWLASGSKDNTIRIWDTVTGRQILKRQAVAVWSVTFSPDGKRIAWAGVEDANAVVKVWSTEKLQEVLTYRGHSGPELKIAFSLDGKRIVSGGRTGIVKVWETESGQTILTLPGDVSSGTDLFRGNRGVDGIAVSADGTRIIATSRDGTIRIWDARPLDNSK
jgi:WD40 repeat protein